MYTEDDEEVKSKNKDFNSNYSDFYTSFDELGKSENKTAKKNNKKKTNPKQIKEKDVVEEHDNYNTNYDGEVYNGDSKNLKIFRLGLVILTAIIVIVVIILLIIKGNNVKGDIELTNDNISLTVGDSDYISYKIVDTEHDVISTFESSNDDVVVVDEYGKITAVGNGKASIIISYTIDGKTREKECIVEVKGDSDVNQNITLNIKFNSGENNKWTNKDVSITVQANSIFDIDKIQYAINCDSTCSYKEINNNSNIKISSSGITTIKVVATDKKKQKAEKEVTIKIDKEAPNIEFNNHNITSDKDVEVCATCSDSLSGCKQTKVCKKYTSSSSKQTITVYDNAGNKKNSGSFNVTINKPNSKTSTPTPTKSPSSNNQLCSLNVSSNGVVTATLFISATKYGFDSSFSGNNELSKTISIKAYKNGVEGDANGARGAKIVHYYVKNKNGDIGQCYITVVKECSCSTSESGCKVNCTYRPN